MKRSLADAVMVAVCCWTAISAVNGFLVATTRTTIPPPVRSSALQAVLVPGVKEKEVLDDFCDVAVFGGGFGGLYTALALSREAARKQQRRLDVVLVEPTDSFVFLPLLYDLTVGTATEAEVCPLYADLLRNTGVRHVRASLQSLTTSHVAELGPPNDSSSSSAAAAATPTTVRRLRFKAGVIAVGASPASILAATPGAAVYAQPFYTAADAKSTRRLLNRLHDQMRMTGGTHAVDVPRIAVVGGGYGGVELAASIQRRLGGVVAANARAAGSSSAAPTNVVTLLSRGPPMAGTRAEPLVKAALQKLGVNVRECSVVALAPPSSSSSSSGTKKVLVQTKKWGTVVDDDDDDDDDNVPWDAVLWTAGSSPSDPVPAGCRGLMQSPSGRLAVDATLRCINSISADDDDTDNNYMMGSKQGAQPQPRLWALGDCAEVVVIKSQQQDQQQQQPAFPKTAQVAMQQAETVAENVLAHLLMDGRTCNSGPPPAKTFVYQDLGSMLTLGGPNAVVMAPREGALLAPIFAPVLDTANSLLGVADDVVAALFGRAALEQLGLPSPDTLGLSLGSHGLGVDDGAAPGTLAGTLSGAARRTVYAARMPTNQQRAVSLVSAAIATAAALAKESADRNNKK